MSNVTKCTTSTHSAARCLDIVSRLITLVMCVYIAVTPSLVLANSYSGAVDFHGFNNFVRTAGGAIADFWFKNKNTAQAFASKANISNGMLGGVAFKRILRLTPIGIATGFAVDEIVSALTAEGWIVDVANQEIYKPTGGWCVNANSYAQERQFCADNPVNAAAIYIAHVNPILKDQKKMTGSDGKITYGLYGQMSTPVLKSESTSYAQVDAKVTYSDPAYAPASAQIFLQKFDQGKILATQADVADVLPKVSDAQIESLVGTPDFAKEPHAPTLAAAAAAGVATPALDGPAGCASRGMGHGTFNGTVHCVNPEVAGVKDNLSGDTVGTNTGTDAATNPQTETKTTTTTTTNPDGSVTETKTTTTKNPDGTTTTTTTTTTKNPDGTTSETTKTDAKPKETPAFCAWAQTLCNWLDWTKEEPAKPTESANKVPVGAISESDVLPNFDIYQERVYFNDQCPAPIPIDVSLFGKSVTTDFSYKPLCDFMSAIKPFVIASAYITGAYIISGVGRGGGNDG